MSDIPATQKLINDLIESIYFILSYIMPYVCLWFFVKFCMKYCRIGVHLKIWIIRIITSVLYVLVLWLFKYSSYKFVIGAGLISLYPPLVCGGLIGGIRFVLLAVFIFWGIYYVIKKQIYRLKGKQMPKEENQQNEWTETEYYKYMCSELKALQEIIIYKKDYLPFIMMLLYTFGVVFFRKYNFSEDVENLVFGLFVVNLLLFIPLFFWKKYTSVIALFMFGIYLILVFLGKSPFILVDICFLFVFTYLFYKRHDKMIKLY